MDKENEMLEFKKSPSQLKEGIISLASMLNKHGRGELFIGVNDDGKPFRFDIGKKTLSDVSNELRTNLKPLPLRVEIGEMEFKGTPIIRVYVEGGDAPYSAYGRYFVRIDDADIPMTSSQLQEYFENKKDNYSKWEEKPSGHSIEEIDEDLVVQVIRDANEKGRLTYVYRNLREALAKLDLLNEDGGIKTAGFYLFAKHGPLKIKEAVYPTDSRSDFGEIKEFEGNIFECINEAVRYIQNHIFYKSEILGLQRIETPEIPIRAIREIVVNSFAHANYGIESDCNQFIVFKSTVRIYNPGPIYKNIDPMSFAAAKVGSKLRNILIASVLYKAGLIDAFGTGFDRTFTLCAQSGVEYEYRNDDFGFTFVFKRKQGFLDDKINDKINDKIKSIDQAILGEVRKNKFITISELSMTIGKSEPTIYRHVETLVAKGLLKRIGSRKAGYWKTIDQ